MPEAFKRPYLYVLIAIPLIIILSFSAILQSYEGIETYYIRYDVKSSKNQIIDDNLLMIPSKNEFRAENFSQIFVTGVISTTFENSKTSIEKAIKDNSLKKVLVNNGLKSVKIKDYDTVISYEGVIITPLNIIHKNYNKDQDNYFYKVEVEFSPIAFPDKWESLNLKYKFKQMVYDFFNLFK